MKRAMLQFYPKQHSHKKQEIVSEAVILIHPKIYLLEKTSLLQNSSLRPISLAVSTRKTEVSFQAHFPHKTHLPFNCSSNGWLLFVPGQPGGNTINFFKFLFFVKEGYCMSTWILIGNRTPDGSKIKQKLGLQISSHC